MFAIRTVAFATLAALSTYATAEPQRQHLELVNRAHASVTAIAVANAGSDTFRDLTLAGPLRGGGGATAIEVAGEACRVDLRFQFLDGRAALSRNVDICRTRAFRIQPLPQAAGVGTPVERLSSR